MKKLLCLALLLSAGSVYTGSVSASNQPAGKKSGNNSKDIYKKTWIDFNKNGVKDVYEDPSAPIEARIADLLSQMTLEEKTCQMATLYGSGRVLKDAWPTDGWSTEIWKDGIGNIDEQANGLGKFGSELSYPYANSVKNRHEIQRWFVEQTRLGIPVDFTNEGIRGLCHDRATMFPAQCGQGATWNKKLIREIAKVTANEAKALGYTNIYSPILDIAQDPRWGRVVECYGEDPYLNTVFGVASVKGYQGEKLSDPYSIAACLKHYVGYGVSEGGRDYRYTDISPQALWETYLPPYEAGVKAGAATLMSSFNDISGIPATSNHYILTEILKNKWQHDGFVVSDWNAIEQLIYQGVAKDRKEAAYKAFHAGVEMDMRDNVYCEYLEQLVAEKKIQVSQIDDAVARILRLKFRLGLFDEPYAKELIEQERYLQQEDIALAGRLAEESMVLLKNANNLLPFSSMIKKVAVIGPIAKDSVNLLGAWAFKGKAEDVETIYEGMQKEFGDKVRLDYEQGCALDGSDESGFSAALKTAEASDVVVLCLGESKQWSGENASRSTIALPDIQEKLLLHLKQANKPIVLVLSSGRPLELIRLEPQVEAIIEMWQPGVAGGTPLAGILSGRVNPSGKLSVTFPLSTGQIPVYYNMRQSARPFDAMGDYQDIPTEPLYSFGYGLSYTTFVYSDAKLSSLKIRKDQKITAEVTVTNAGKVEGKETVLWYVSDPFCTISRPMKELKFFEKQSLNAGESRVFRFDIDPMRDLSYTDATGKRFLEPGEFIVSVGGRKLTFEVVD